MPASNLVIIEDSRDLPIPTDNHVFITPDSYLDPGSVQKYPSARVFNLCRSYGYQTKGYYVSLLAEARGHRAIPSVTTLRDFDSPMVIRSLGEDLHEVIQQALKKDPGDTFSMLIHFGQADNPGLQQLAASVYRMFPSPILGIDLVRKDRWILSRVRALSPVELDGEDRAVLQESAKRFFQRRTVMPKIPRQRFLYDLAILINPDEAHPPSNPRAIEKFVEAARDVGFYTELIRSEDADRICEFDALFIRETTSVNHPTYYLSRLAHAEGLVVVDDPWSIQRCSNKIYPNEVLERAKLPAPRTWILTRESMGGGTLEKLPLPCILKQPDSAFSAGVFKAETAGEIREHLESMLRESEIILAQEFVPSKFDWRIGVLDHQPVFACKYYMAQGHWQIYNWKAGNPRRMSGDAETVHVEFVPQVVIDTALKATRLIGDGLYGVDIKLAGNRAMIIEINDNPNIDAGIEDKALGMELYSRIARSLRRRIELARA